jgi:hypothetical protein
VFANNQLVQGSISSTWINPFKAISFSFLSTNGGQNVQIWTQKIPKFFR